MLALTVILSLCGIALVTGNHQMFVHNNCGKEIWVGVLPPAQYGGGFSIQSGQVKTLNVADHWSGRVWGRTGCGRGSCQTGDCGGGRLQCSGAGVYLQECFEECIYMTVATSVDSDQQVTHDVLFTGRINRCIRHQLATLAEITFDGAGNQDFYDISLVDGYNLKLQMYPRGGTHDTANHGQYYCGRAGCNTDLNANCPSELQVHGTGGVVACKSACLAFNRDDYCCRNAHNTPQTCPYFDYARQFKNACPEAYSYAYDDQKSTFTCRGNGGTKSAYDIVFC